VLTDAVTTKEKGSETSRQKQQKEKYVKL